MSGWPQKGQLWNHAEAFSGALSVAEASCPTLSRGQQGSAGLRILGSHVHTGKERWAFGTSLSTLKYTDLGEKASSALQCPLRKYKCLPLLCLFTQVSNFYFKSNQNDFFFLTAPCGMWDLSSPTRGSTHAPCSGSTES